jgi:hypothetical protein
VVVVVVVVVEEEEEEDGDAEVFAFLEEDDLDVAALFFGMICEQAGSGQGRKEGGVVPKSMIKGAGCGEVLGGSNKLKLKC